MCSIYFSKINYFKQLKKNTLSILVFFLKYQNRSSMVRFFWKGLRIFRWTISSKEIAIQIDFPKRRDQILRLFLGIFLEERKFERMRNALRIFRKDISSSWRWTFLTNYCKKYSLPFFLNTLFSRENDLWKDLAISLSSKLKTNYLEKTYSADQNVITTTCFESFFPIFLAIFLL